MDILLSGASGFIGEYVRKAFSSKHRVFALTRDEAPRDEQGIAWIGVDLSLPDHRVELPPKVDAVVFLAQSRHYREFPEKAWPIFNVNIRALMMMLEYARQCGAKQFLFASSANVYKRSQRPITERSALEPTTFYARSKRIAELLVESYADWFRCHIFRVFTVYGPGQKGMLIPSLVERVRKGQLIDIQGRCGFKLTPVYVTDVSTAMQAAVESDTVTPGCDVFNLGGDKALSIYELGCGIGKVLNISPEFRFIKGERPAGWVADSAKLKRTFKLGPFVPFEHGIDRVVHG